MGGVRLPIITGPTGAGKSALALALARAHGGAIISADSRQIYRGFDIGTAKPTAEEQRDVPHAGIDVADPAERFSAARFARLAREALRHFREQGRPVMVVGGTGFYVRALVQPLAAVPALDLDRRAALAGVLARLDTPTLRRWCERLDPARSQLGRTQLLRAVETVLLTGERISDHFGTDPPAPGDFEPSYLIVDPGARLVHAIERRVDDMFRRGWLDEVRRLAQSVAHDAPAWNATGYNVLRRYVVGETDAGLDGVRTRIITATRQYAKRQRTWLRHQIRGDVLMVDPGDTAALDRATEWWREFAA